MKYCYGLMLLLMLCTSCISLGETALGGPYYVAQDPAASYKTLYYRGPDGLDFERVPNVRRAGYTAEFIFVESAQGFYLLDRALDQPTDSSDPTVQKALLGPLPAAEFKALLSRLRIPDFAFHYSAL
ncbi:hypothetical protein [Hymenobacter persicinus]|uniref:Uncharacterized protein n=1 Tax=Hymenobacter persicinus TaxID=2025506 RepID=A0A4Q5LBZ9_9BACT|nr:hypothetical protein [Hymenobacter persicinus]RYU79716.1 hypothetical protein EWM57_09910 [Hymenobacter persicinus]